MEYEFSNIPVEIDGEAHAVDYRYKESGKYGQACYITSEGKQLVVDEDFGVLESTMPKHWKQPVIDRLVALLAVRRRNV